ncbi:tripartite motif-containing protein 2-like [Gigantopelta aegis]|uniref:tripartite motif-containing protein 2-like n=1 Tax=Gigantopelta aegis TaxID=1735272 RepID=UPI001B88BCAE|nr:tripartite motif-containing protein 2-like [Gigantopelta aegis]
MELNGEHQQTDRNLICAICREDMKHSKQLPCLHTFCCSCLDDYIKHNTRGGEPTISCPQCRRRITVPENGASDFPSSYCVLARSASSRIESGDLTCGECGKENYAIGFCIECSRNLCRDCKEKHKAAADTHSHHILVMGDGRKRVEKCCMCAIHPDRELKFYCQGCKEPICQDCRLTKHYDKVAHPAVDISEVADVDRRRLTSLIENLSVYLPPFQKAQHSANNVIDELKNHAHDVVADINAWREEVQSKVNLLCDDDIKFVKDRLQGCLKELEPTHGDINEELDFLCRAIDTAKPVHQMGDDVKVVNVTKEMENLLVKYSQLKPKSLPRKRFIFTKELYNSNTLNNYIGLMGFEYTKLKLDFTFETDHLMDYSIIPETDSTAWMSYFTSEESALVLYDQTGQKKEDISLTPFGRSRVALLGKSFLISSKVEKKVFLFPGNSLPPVEFASTDLPPRGLAVTADNLILIVASVSEITDEAENVLLVYSQRGELIKEVKEENGEKIFRSPRYVAVNINGDVIVSDQGSHCVVIMNKNLEVKGHYTLNQSNPFCPRGICCDKYGRIIVTDSCNNRIHLVSADGKFIRFLLTEEDGLNWPQLVAIGPGDKLWVACRGCVQVYDYVLE